MSTHLTVRQLGQVAAGHHATLATLPETLRVIESGVPDIALVGSGKAAFDEALALSPKAIVIADPTAIDAALSQQLLRASCLVIPAMTLGANLSQIHREEIPEKIGLIHSRHTSQGEVNAAIFEHLVGLANVVDGLTDVRLLSVVSNGYVASAKNADGVEVTWSGLAGAASAYYELDMVGLSDRLDVRIDLDGSARPLIIRRANARGSIQPVGSYETGLRRFWRGVADGLRTGARVMQWKDIANLHALAENFVQQASRPNRASA